MTSVEEKKEQKQKILQKREIGNNFYNKIMKRAIDIVLSGIGIIVAIIPMIIIGIIVKADSSGPVFFKQKRIGAKKQEFNIIKFRSMPVNAPHNTPTHQFKAEDLLSKWQKFIRKTSIDELPQLFNILKGDMSVVGPRPALWNQFDLIQERDKYGANDIRPGLTGLAQINGRDELEIELKAKYDGEYTRQIDAGGFKAFGMDVKCFFKSITAVFKSEGVVEGGTGKKAEAEKEEITAK